jgi:hypothetical protein
MNTRGRVRGGAFTRVAAAEQEEVVVAPAAEEVAATG